MAKVTKRATAVAVTRSLSRKTSRELHLTAGQRKEILEKQDNNKNAK
jgi:hypothetical protein